jgi:phosphonate transport system ATP-binding protein
MTFLKLDNLSVQYSGTKVLNNFSIKIEQGEKIALVGQSGAGKSTLLNLLYQKCKDEASLVPQDLGLVRALSVFHNIYIGRLNQHSTWYNILNLIKPLKKEIDQILPIVEQLGIKNKIFEPIRELSTFFGDEPVSAVDDHQSDSVMKCIIENHETAILSMHDVNLALKYSTRMIGIKNGKKVMDKSSKNLKAADLDDIYN